MIWGSFLGGLTRSEFSRMFRMDHATFEFVVERLSPRLQRDFLQSERGGGYISPSLQVGFTIRWLAGGSSLDLRERYGVSRSSFYKLTNECIDAIVAEFPIEFDLSPAVLKAREAYYRLRLSLFLARSLPHSLPPSVRPSVPPSLSLSLSLSRTQCLT